MHKLFTKGLSFILILSVFFTFSASPALAAVTYIYDANGNMLSDGEDCYHYNEANQMDKVTKCANGETIAEYVYDYTGMRLVKKEFENGVLKRTVYSPADEFETVKQASNGATANTTYYKANDELIAKKNPDGSITYYHNDHLGSSAVLSDETGAVVEKTSYEPYGEVKSGGTKSKFGYTGQEKDNETGLNYYNARYYDPHIQRFIQPDDIIQDPYISQDLNKYSYTRNNPVKYTDPTGHVVQIPLAIYLYVTTLAVSPDTSIDMQFFAMAGAEYIKNPTSENKYNALLAGASIALPGASTGPQAATTISKAVASGKYGEKQLDKLYQGASQQYFYVKGLGARIVDKVQTLTNAGHESKSGYQSLTKSVQQQINKDAQLVKTGVLKEYTWHFFVSPITKKGGASNPLKEALKKSGLNYIEYLM